MLFFEQRQVPARLPENRGWNPRQCGHLQTITLAGRPFAHRVQEDNPVLVFYRLQMHVFHGFLFAGQLRQLEIVGGKQRVCSNVPGQVDGAGRGQGQAVIRAGSAADFIQQYQAVAAGIVQDVGGLRHLDHEGGTPAGQVIAGADTGKYAVDRTDDGRPGRHPAAGVSQQDNQRGLAHVS